MLTESRRFVASCTGWLASTRRRLWWITFGTLTLFISLWAIGAPYFSGPDEAMHVTRAWSVAHGDVLGENPNFGGVRIVHVPMWLTTARTDPACFKLDPQIPAGCHSITSDSSDATTETNGAQIPTFYIPTGLPFLVATGGPGLLLARIVGGAISAAFLASALLTARRSAARRWLVPAMAIAVPPMLLYISAVTNPSGMEIAAAVSLWLAAIVLATERAIEPRLVVRLVVAVAGVMLARQSGPFWVVVVLVFAAVMAGRSRIGELARSRAMWLAAGATVVLGIVWAGWTLTAHPFLLEANPNGIDAPAREVLAAQVGRMWALTQEAVGVFGWLDTRAPFLTYLVWVSAVVLLVALCAMCARRRTAYLPIVLLVVALAVQTYSEFRAVAALGFFWQGRYTLPMLVGVPLLAGCGIGGSARAPFVAARAVRMGATAIGVALFLAYFQFLRRYAVGAANSLAFWANPSWTPPVPIPLLLIGSILAIGGWLVVLVAAASNDDGVPDGAAASGAAGVEFVVA